MSQIFSLSPSHPMPLYAQLTRAIQFAIATGRLRIGEQLPTVRQLAVELRVNANTAAKVYAELERAGVLETRRGVGTFVASLRETSESQRERARYLMELGDRFLAEARTLGFSAQEAVDSLSARLREAKGKDVDARPQNQKK